MIIYFLLNDGTEIEVDTVDDTSPIFDDFCSFTEWYEELMDSGNDIDEITINLPYVTVEDDIFFDSTHVPMIEEMFEAEDDDMLNEFCAYYCDMNCHVEYRYFQEAYIGSFKTFGAFAEERYSEEIGYTLAQYIDWEAYAKGELRHDYSFHEEEEIVWRDY